MKQYFFLILILFISSCSNKPKLNGDWSYVKNDSIYFEVNFDDNVMGLYNYEFGVFPKQTYSVKSDSLIIYNNKIKNQYSLKLINANEILLYGMNDKIKLTKIYGNSIKINKITKENLFDYEIQYLNRKNSFFGVKYQHNIDSLKSQISKMDSPDVEKLGNGSPRCR